MSDHEGADVPPASRHALLHEHGWQARRGADGSGSAEAPVAQGIGCTLRQGWGMNGRREATR
ncbi:hypothetical protein [Rhabdothermincola sediminis]|uniref:hypothetical protein n=1 Tax=Rhabdothermincola sediminis TaxID=2751370 RepID=UPI001AA08DE0|nr:hypothetical protein [Rhabdothermincola sediminis]